MIHGVAIWPEAGAETGPFGTSAMRLVSARRVFWGAFCDTRAC